MMRVEDHHYQICAFHQLRRKRRTGLLDGDVVVLAEVAGQCGGGRALSVNSLIRVGVDVVNVIETCPFAVFLEFEGGGPGEGKRVAGHIAVSDCSDHAVSHLLTADWVSQLLRQGNSHKEEQNHSLHSYLNNNLIITQATANQLIQPSKPYLTVAFSLFHMRYFPSAPFF